MWPKSTAAILAVVASLAKAQIDRTGWQITADSFQPGNEPANAIDASTTSIFHTEWTPVNVPFPHNLTIDMKTSYNINAVSYLPRQDGNSNGNIGQHRMYILGCFFRLLCVSFPEFWSTFLEQMKSLRFRDMSQLDRQYLD